MAKTSGQHNLPAYNSARSRERLAQNRKRKAAPSLFTARGYGSAGDARHAASRAAVNAEPAAWLRPADNKWVPVVLLRTDQTWMCEHLGYVGVVPWPAERPLDGLRARARDLDSERLSTVSALRSGCSASKKKSPPAPFCR